MDLDFPIPLLTMSDRQDLYSMAYVQAIIAASGFNFSKQALDRSSIDLFIDMPSDYHGDQHYPRLGVQVKCSYTHTLQGDNLIHFPLSMKNYNDLRRGMVPAILVLVIVPRPDHNPIVPWIECIDQHTVFRYRAYWKSLYNENDVENSDNVTVTISADHEFDIHAVGYLMENMVIQGNKNL